MHKEIKNKVNKLIKMKKANPINKVLVNLNKWEKVKK